MSHPFQWFCAKLKIFCMDIQPLSFIACTALVLKWENHLLGLQSIFPPALRLQSKTENKAPSAGLAL